MDNIRIRLNEIDNEIRQIMFADENLKEIQTLSSKEKELLDKLNKEKKEFWEKMDENELAKQKLKTPLDWAEWRWFRLLDKYSEDFGEMDWEAFNDEFAAERATWGEELVARFDRYQAAKNQEQHAPEVARYYKELNILDDAGYWGTEALDAQVLAWDKKMPKKADGTGLAEEWDKWLAGGR